MRNPKSLQELLEQLIGKASPDAGTLSQEMVRELSRISDPGKPVTKDHVETVLRYFRDRIPALTSDLVISDKAMHLARVANSEPAADPNGTVITNPSKLRDRAKIAYQDNKFWAGALLALLLLLLYWGGGSAIGRFRAWWNEPKAEEAKQELVEHGKCESELESLKMERMGLQGQFNQLKESSDICFATMKDCVCGKKPQAAANSGGAGRSGSAENQRQRGRGDGGDGGRDRDRQALKDERAENDRLRRQVTELQNRPPPAPVVVQQPAPETFTPKRRVRFVPDPNAPAGNVEAVAGGQ